MIVSHKQIKAARAYLEWSQQELADRSTISLETIRRLEQGRGFQQTSLATLAKIEEAFSKAGIMLKELSDGTKKIEIIIQPDD